MEECGTLKELCSPDIGRMLAIPQDTEEDSVTATDIFRPLHRSVLAGRVLLSTKQPKITRKKGSTLNTLFLCGLLMADYPKKGNLGDSCLIHHSFGNVNIFWF